MNTASQKSPILSTKKEYLFRALLVLSPFLILLIAELSLRLFGYGENLDLFITLEKNSKYWITNPNLGRRYFLQKDFLPATSYDAFLKQKPANAYRIFVLGESTTAGFPYFNNGAFPRLLAQRLQFEYPDRLIEVVNLGLPAVSSYALLDFADELVDYQPDAVLVYAGHNEFYGALASGSTESFGRSRWLIKTYLKLQHFKLVQLLRSGMAAMKTKPEHAAGVERNTLMARMVGQQQIAHRSELYNATLNAFRDNLAEIVRTFQSSGIRVMLSELVSNIGDQKPFVSVFQAQTDRVLWQKLFADGLALAQKDSCAAALAAFQRVAALDAAPAIVHFHIAECLKRLSRFSQARQEFENARDGDALRFRASEDFTRTIRELGAQLDAPVVAMIEVFAASSPHAIIGRELMLDHLHPNLRGYFLMAQAFAETMKRRNFLPAPQVESTALEDSILWRRRGVTPVDEEAARLRIQLLTSNWPFQADIQRVNQLHYQPGNEMERLAYALLRDEISWDLAHMQLAEHYLKAKQNEQAALEYEALLQGMPYIVAPYLRLGLTYLALNRLDEAFAVFEKSLSVESSAIAQKWLGAISIHKNQTAAGIAYLQRALTMQPNDPETLYNLSIGYAKAGEFANAKSYAETLVRDYPQYPGAREHWQRLQQFN